MSAIGNADEICATIGAVALWRLADARGGTQLWIPTTVENAQQLVQYIGVEAATRLIEEYGGFRIQVPNFRATPASDKHVAPLLKMGFPDWEVAMIAQVTEKTVRAVRRRQNSTAGSLPGVKQN